MWRLLQRNRLAWPHRRRELASDGVRYADARSSVGRRVRSVAKLRHARILKYWNMDCVCTIIEQAVQLALLTAKYLDKKTRRCVEFIRARSISVSRVDPMLFYSETRACSYLWACDEICSRRRGPLQNHARILKYWNTDCVRNQAG